MIAGTPCRATRVAADFLDFPGGVAPRFGSEKVSRYTGVLQLQLRVSRYTVQLRIAARQFLPLNCRKGAILKEEKNVLYCAGEAIWKAFSETICHLGEGNWESKIAARQWGVNFCREASRCLARPSGLEIADRHTSNFGILETYCHLRSSKSRSSTRQLLASKCVCVRVRI